jgi:hypothetical protein
LYILYNIDELLVRTAVSIDQLRREGINLFVSIDQLRREGINLFVSIDQLRREGIYLSTLKDCLTSTVLMVLSSMLSGWVSPPYSQLI